MAMPTRLRLAPPGGTGFPRSGGAPPAPSRPGGVRGVRGVRRMRRQERQGVRQALLARARRGRRRRPCPSARSARAGRRRTAARRRRAPRGAGAAPVQVVAARAPAAAVVLADGDYSSSVPSGRSIHSKVAADRQLPAHVRLGLQRRASLGQRQPWSAQPSPPGKTGRLRKMQRAVDAAGACRSPSSSVRSSRCGEVPSAWNCHVLGVEPRGVARRPGARRPRRRSGRRGCSSRVAAGPDDALAAAAEDAVPARGQPGQVAAEDLLRVGRVGELDPGPGEVQRDLLGPRPRRRRVVPAPVWPASPCSSWPPRQRKPPGSVVVHETRGSRRGVEHRPSAGG